MLGSRHLRRAAAFALAPLAAVALSASAEVILTAPDGITADRFASDVALSGDDPGCRDERWPLENPQCQNGLNDDGGPGVDYDGGALVFGNPIDDPDPECIGLPYRNAERRNCGLGYELAPLLVGIRLLPRRRRRG
jgi:hypothetical protein